MSKIWSGTYKVHTYEMDKTQKVSIQGICGYVIDAAAHNAHDLGFSIPQLLEQNKTWFLSRFLLQLDTYPSWRKKITVETWPSGTQKFFAVRDWRLFCGQQLIGQATSGWLMIDNRNRRPIRPDSYGFWHNIMHPERAIPHTFSKIPELDHDRDLSRRQGFTVRFDDVDINNHANYLSYIDWILESIPPEVRIEEEIAEMEIHFLAEVNFGEDILTHSLLAGERSIHSLSDDLSSSAIGTEYHHSLVRRQDEAEVARARTVWRPVT